MDSKDLNISQLYRINPELIKEMQIPSRLVESVGFISTSRVCGELSGRTHFYLFVFFSFSFMVFWEDLVASFYVGGRC